MKQNTGRKLISFLLTLAMVVVLMPGMTLTARADNESFSLGSFDYATDTFNAAVGTGSEKYKTLLIAYGKTPLSDPVSKGLTVDDKEQLVLPTVDGFVKNVSTSTSCSTVIDMEGGKTLGEIAEYVKKIKFQNSKHLGQDIQITITDQVIRNKTFYFKGTKHYYQYITGSYKWSDAYNAAKGMTYAGREGYLATITSPEEDLFIYHAASVVGWLGGTDSIHGQQSGQYYEGDFTEDGDDQDWYWACGPEIGTVFYHGSGWAKQDYEQAAGYINWCTSGEPTGGTEFYLLTNWTGNKGYNTQDLNLVNPSNASQYYSWNDWPNGDGAKTGYFVEFGDQGASDGWGDSGSGNLDGTVTASATIDHTHAFTYTADGATITAKCTEGCSDSYDTGGVTLTIVKPARTTVSGTESAEAVITGYPDSAPANLAAAPTEITYQTKNGESWSDATTTAPTAAGIHKASFTWGEKTASVEYQIFVPISQTVTFKVVNGSWNEGEGDAATEDKTVTLNGYEGYPLKLTADQIPAVGNKPNDGCKVGSWDVIPSTEIAIIENTTYTYTYVQSAIVRTPPQEKSLTYTGSAQELVTAGIATGGEMKYALGTNATTAPDASAYTTSIPTATEAGTYYVWYKVDPATNYNGVDPACIVVEIEIAKGEAKFEQSEDVQEVKGVDLVEVKTQLDEIASEIANADNTEKGDNQIKDITVTLKTKTVKVDDVSVNETSAITLKANEKIPSSDQESSKISYLNINVNKNVKVYNVNENGMPVGDPVKNEDTTLTTLPGVIDIPVKYDLTNLHNLQVVRYHGDKAEAFTKLDKKSTTLRDLTFFVEGSGANATVHIYTKEFSTYALITSGTKEYKNETSTTTPTETTEKVESVTVYRLYYGPTMEHFYTTSAYERRVLIDKYGWVDEGIAWKSPKAPTTDAEKKTIKPVYRLFNPFTTDHHYTKDANERKTLIDKYGWKDEGIAFYSNEKGDATVYRLWHPGLITGAHHFTTGKHEYDVLITRGWIGETEAFKVNAAS
uniref:DUF5648 domain-containing protein n=1 Tax=Eubacterium cellulosolvens (strain ATCC 43171 / JCM 9499 / 6) TaxID=633697 RepID=I5AQ28_EUBC6